MLSSLLLPFLRLIPQRIHFGERCLGRCLAGFRQSVLDRRETPFDLQIGHAQRGFRIGASRTEKPAQQFVLGRVEVDLAGLVLDGEAQLVPDTDIGKNAGGFHLGPVGGRIVAEVVIGLLDSDPNSYLVQQPGWTPTLQRPGPSFRMTDFLTFAGVDPATRRTKRPDLA